jgi:hypothetical protein
MATPVLSPETKVKNKNNNVNLTRIEKERLERLKKLNPEVPKDVTSAERRLQAGKYGSMDDDTYDPASMRKKPKSNPVVVSQAKRAQAASDIRVEKEADRLKKLKLKTDAKEEEARVKRAKEEEARVKRAKDVASAERRLQAGKYGSMNDDTYDPASMRKKPKRKVNTSQTPSVSKEVTSAERRLQAGKYGEIEEGNPAPFKKPKPKVNTSETPSVSKEVALAERRLQAGKYGSMDDDTYDLASMRKKPKSERKRAPYKNPVKQAITPENKRKVDLANVPVPVKPKPKPKADNSNFRNVKVPVKPKTPALLIETPNADSLKSVKRPTKTSQEAKERNSVKTAEKKRDRLFGLDFLPEIDSKEGGDKVNLPFGLGSYETLPIEEDYSRNKKGGRINRKSGGKIRKAGCQRGMGKAMRGY